MKNWLIHLYVNI